jgi:hypothetical protein
MAFDQTRVGQMTAQLMEGLDQIYTDECELGDLLLIAEVIGPHGSNIHHHATNPRLHANIGLIRFVDGVMMSGVRPAGAE